MEFSIFRAVILGLAFLTIVALGAAIWRGIVASTLGTGSRKGRAIFTASVSFAVALLLWASMLLLVRWLPSVSEAEGHIVSVQVHSRTHSHPTDLQIQENSGGYLYLHAEDRSPFFQPGERLKVQYQPDTRSLIEAQFFSADGRQEGVFRDATPFYSFLLISLALFLIWSAFKKYRRDPEAAEKPSGRYAEAVPTTLGLSVGHIQPLERKRHQKSIRQP